MVKNILLLIVLLGFVYSFTVNATELKCGEQVTFYMPGVYKEDAKNIALSDSVSMEVKQFIATRNTEGYKIAVNVMCQSLTGQKYTGSSEEWVQFFNSTLAGFSKQQYKDLTFTLVGDDDAIIQDNKLSKEYLLTGKKGDDKQIIKSLALISTDMNSIFTIAISANEAIEDKINNLYENLVTYVEKNSTIKS